ncbi:nucleotide exchange factor GrpE [Halosquirtibacter xylanolyticus]|uniref:nucleotide exchange factor GrpE n=1 Tax=Halosquirtibacter xylanolyticus TaxID=3374599 RepID=UPI0037484B11|nr:nucleotide exchange factor GrpE [Prolixibacteraceae bacterium]
MTDKKVHTEEQEEIKDINQEGVENTKDSEATDANEEVKDGATTTETESNDVEKQLAEQKDKYMRLSAEFDNYRRRTLKEKMDLTKSAGEKVIVDILPVVDDVERAISAINVTDENRNVFEGVELIYTKLKDFLKKNGVVELGSVGDVFDTDHYEALTKIPAPSEDLKGKVVDVIEKGYTLNDKVIRFAKVVIGE